MFLNSPIKVCLVLGSFTSSISITALILVFSFCILKGCLLSTGILVISPILSRNFDTPPPKPQLQQ